MRALGSTTRALTVVARHRIRPGERAEPEWLSRGFRRELAAVVARRIPVLVVYGEDDNYRRELELACAGELGVIVAGAGPLLEVEVVPGKIHGPPASPPRRRRWPSSSGGLSGPSSGRPTRAGVIRIVHVVDSLAETGGAERRLVEEVVAMSDRFADQRVVRLFERDELQDRLERAGIPVTALD